MSKPYRVIVLLEVDLGPLVRATNSLEAFVRASKLDLKRCIKIMGQKETIEHCSEILKIYTWEDPNA